MQRPASRFHVGVLALCVTGCLVNGLWPREPRPSPQEDAAVLMRAVLTRVLGVDGEHPAAR